MKWRSVGESWGTLGFGGDGGGCGGDDGYDDCLIVDAAAVAVDGDEGGDTWPAPEKVADRCCRIEEEEAQNDVNIEGDHDSADGEKEEEAAGERLSHSKADSVAAADSVVAAAGSGEADEAAAAAVAGDDKSQTDLERPDHCATSAVAAAVQPLCTTAWTPTCTADD